MPKVQLSKKAAKKKGAKKKAPKKKAAKGKRYSETEKNKVLEFVERVNLDKGRGGVAAAVRKFGITALTVSSWIKKGGASASTAGKAGRGAQGREGVLGQLLDLQKQISTGRTELDKLEKKFESLKKAL